MRRTRGSCPGRNQGGKGRAWLTRGEMRHMNALKKAYRVFSTAEKYFLFVIFFFATVMVVVNVLGR